MTVWTNIGIFTESEEDKKDILKYLLNNKENSIVDDSPPTLMYGDLRDDMLEDIVKEYLVEYEGVTTVVVVENSDTGDWASASVYTEPDDPDDLRDMVKEDINGRSGADGGDVKSELISRGLNMSIKQFFNTLDREDHMDLLLD